MHCYHISKAASSVFCKFKFKFLAVSLKRQPVKVFFFFFFKTFQMCFLEYDRHPFWGKPNFKKYTKNDFLHFSFFYGWSNSFLSDVCFWKIQEKRDLAARRPFNRIFFVNRKPKPFLFSSGKKVELTNLKIVLFSSPALNFLKSHNLWIYEFMNTSCKKFLQWHTSFSSF